ncbi:hypothetical protein H5410_040749 [Solanum commersonii]|uniref:Uncharacterized protein n=1 Tax=Solanum commersonii TaxID=4109 RepID=A0A9J5XPP3_SOLCO|nr:hypothetical protein H5410_040749 [Solanum commersonii]
MMFPSVFYISRNQNDHTSTLQSSRNSFTHHLLVVRVKPNCKRVQSQGLNAVVWVSPPFHHLHRRSFLILRVLPRGHRRHIASFRDMGISNALESKEPIDWPSLMIKHMARSILAECGLIVEPAQVPIASPRASGPVTRLLKDLQAARDQCETLQNENMSLRTKLTVSKEEVERLKYQLVQQQLDNNARVDRVLQLLASSSSCPPNLSHSSS